MGMNTKHPKKTIVSTKYTPVGNQSAAQHWSRRNNSSSVSSCMQSCKSPDLYLSDDEDQPRRLIIFSKSPPPHEKKKNICPTCYCNTRPVKPLIKCVNVDHCDCKKLGTPPTTSIFLKHSSIANRLDYTKNRASYENYASNYFLDLQEQINKLETELGSVKNINKSSEYKCGSVKSTNNNFESECGSFKNINKSDKACQKNLDSLSEVKDFRKQHFFECRSELKLNPEAHTCKHKFALDKRLKAKPLNVDAFGTSRCTICEKPMKSQSPTLTASSSLGTGLISRSRVSSSTQKSYATSCTSNNSKKSFGFGKIKMGVGSSDIELDVPLSLIDEKVKLSGRKKHRIPVESMALRFQKGVY